MTETAKTRRAVYDTNGPDCPNCGRHKTDSSGNPFNFQYLNTTTGVWSDRAFCSKLCYDTWTTRQP